MKREKESRRTRNPDEVALITGLGRNRVYDLLRSGELPSIRAGRRFLVPDSVLTAWLDACGGKRVQRNG
jgi:excisionase family DNA binding protein